MAFGKYRLSGSGCSVAVNPDGSRRTCSIYAIPATTGMRRRIESITTPILAAAPKGLDTSMPVDTEELVTRLRNARALVVLTGAGVSAASGVPTFRGDDGLWRQYQAEDLATPEAFA